MSYVLQIVRTMESVEMSRHTGEEKKELVMRILESMVGARWGHSVWESRFKIFTDDVIEFIVALSKQQISININRTNLCNII